MAKTKTLVGFQDMCIGFKRGLYIVMKDSSGKKYIHKLDKHDIMNFHKYSIKDKRELVSKYGYK